MYHLIVGVLNDCSLFHCVFLGVFCNEMWAESARFLKQNFIPFSPQNSSFSLSRRRLTSVSRLPLLLLRQMRTVKMCLSLWSVIEDAKTMQDQNWAGASNQIQTNDTICIGRRAVQLSHGPSPLRSHCAARCVAHNANRSAISSSTWGYIPGRGHSAVQCAPSKGGTAAAPVGNPLPGFTWLNTISMFVSSSCSLIAARWRRH